MITLLNFALARGLRPLWLHEEMALPCRVEKVPHPVPDDRTYRLRNPMGQVPFAEDSG